jgi:putative hydrolase of the HAD superfamily
MHRPPLECIVCDVVGTLLYPEPAVATIYSAVGRRYGSRLGPAEVAADFRRVFAEVEAADRAGRRVTSEPRERARWREIVARVLHDATDQDRCFADLWGHFAEPASWRVYPDVEPAFRSWQARGIRIVLASNFDGRLERIAHELAPLDVYSSLVISSRVGWRKPHPGFFEAVRTAAACRPAHVLMVGDDRVNDIEPARLAGMQAVHIDRHSAVAPPGGVCRLTDVSTAAG